MARENSERVSTLRRAKHSVNAETEDTLALLAKQNLFRCQLAQTDCDHPLQSDAVFISCETGQTVNFSF
jgi:hypothetical protein